MQGRDGEPERFGGGVGGAGRTGALGMSFDATRVAERLAALRASRGRVEPMTDGPRDEAEGAAAQVALARAVGADPPPGFKIGATGSRMQAYLGLTEPAAGFMETRALYGLGEWCCRSTGS